MANADEAELVDGSPEEGPSHSMRVYKFGLLGDLPPEAMNELRQSHELAKELVAIDRAHSKAVAEIWASAPELVEVEAETATQQEIVDLLVEEAKKARVRNRSTDIGSDARQALRDARAVLRDLRSRRKDLRDLHYPELKPAFAAANADRKAAVKAMYRVAVDDYGMYWANFNEVTQRYEIARRRVGQQRSEGRVAELRFPRWKGEGTIAVQLQRQAGQIARTPEAIADTAAGPWRNVASIRPIADLAEWPPAQKAIAADRGGHVPEGAAILRFRVGSGEVPTMVEMPVHMHRSVPADADITMMRITRRVVAGKPKVSVSMVVRLAEVPTRTEGPVVAVHMGWRVRSDGSLRVGVVRGAPPAPASLHDVVVRHGDWSEVILPASWRDVWENGTKLRGVRDRNLDVLRAWMIEWLADHPDIAWPEGLDFSTLKKWRSPGRFAFVGLRLQDNVPEGAEEFVRRIGVWRRQDKHLWSWEANERDEIVGQRNDAWRRVAAWICDQAAVVGVDEWSVATIARRPGLTEIDDPQAQASRLNRTMAAPSHLRSAVVNAATGRGVQIVTGGASAVHLACGSTLDPGERRDQVMVWCPSCQTMVDQDRNAVEHLYDAARNLK